MTHTKHTIDVYTDGASQNNQFKSKAKAGVGVWFGYDDKRNVSERLQGQQTNNRAELTAIIRAIETFNNPTKTTKTTNQKVLNIITDSQYCKNGIEKWIQNWKKNGWKTAKRKPVKNQDLWKQLDQLRTQNIVFSWVKAHSGIEGNEQADQLAVQGCDK